MRADLGPWLVAVGLAAVGIAVLDAMRVLRRSPAGVAGALGLAYLAGLAATTVPVVMLLVLGVPFTLLTFALSGAAVGAAALAVSYLRRDTAGPARRAWEGADRVALASFAVLFGVLAVIGLRGSIHLPLDLWDGWSIWTRKALLLTEFDHLSGAFTSPSYEFMHPDYPLLLPLLEAAGFRAAGVADTQAVNGQLWLIFVAGVWALAHLASRLSRPLVWAPLVLLVALAPKALGQAPTGYADVPAGLFLALGCMCLGAWLARGERGWLPLAALMLSGSAATKNEGLVAAVAAIAVAAVVAAWPRDWRRLRPLALAALAFAATVLPWRVWLAVKGIEGDFSLREGLDPGFLLDRRERVGPSLDALRAQVADQDAWVYLVPLGAAVAVVCVALAVRRAVGLFYLGTGALVFALYVWAYWISPYELAFHVRTSVDRVAVGVVFIAVAALLHLAGELERHGRGALATAPDEAASRRRAEPAEVA